MVNDPACARTASEDELLRHGMLVRGETLESDDDAKTDIEGPNSYAGCQPGQDVAAPAAKHFPSPLKQKGVKTENGGGGGA